MNIWPLMFLQFLIYFLPIRESTKCKDTVVITRLWSTAKVATRLTEHCILLYAVLQPGIVLKPMMSTRAKFPSDSFRWNVNILSGTTLLSSLPDKSLSSEASLPSGDQKGEFIGPGNITICTQGRIIVTSVNLNHCIQIFWWQHHFLIPVTLYVYLVRLFIIFFHSNRIILSQ